MTLKRFIYTSQLTVLLLGARMPGFAQEAYGTDSVIRLPAVEINEKQFSRLGSGKVKKLRAGADLTAVSVTASDALRRLPSVITDIEGTLSFRGNSRNALLINGIPYGFLEENSGDVLIQLPALFFPDATLSSVPGTEVVPDGSGSALSLSSASFTNGSALRITAGAGLHERYNGGAAVNLHLGKWRIGARYDYRREFRDRTFTKTLATAAGTKTMDNSASARPGVHVADVSAAYEADTKNRFSVYGLYHAMDYDRYGGIRVTNELAAGTVNKMLRHRYNTQRQDAYAAEARWLHSFSSPEERLEVIFHYDGSGYDEDNHFENENPKGEIVKQDNSAIDQDKQAYYWSAGYRKTLAPSLFFKGGYIGRYKHDRYEAAASDLKNGTWVPNAAGATDFTFKRTIQLVYASLQADVKRFGLEAGLQGEHTRLETRSKGEGEEHRSYFHLYPQVRLGYSDQAGGRWLLTYTQRIDRPVSKELNPFIDRSNDLQTVQGNPALKPEIMHLGELSYTYAAGTVRLVPAAYGRYRTNRIMDVANPSGNDVIWRKENIGSTRTAGMELAAYWAPWRVFSLGASGNVYWDEINGRLLGYGDSKSMTCWDVKGLAKLALGRNAEVQVDGFYVSGQLTAQGKIKGRYAVNAGASYYLFQRKLRLNLSVNNLFDSLKEVTVIDSPDIRLHQERNRDARVGWLSLTYGL
ncbi:MAG: outer membrane beta-barrel family protein [Parabacteroides sp.]|nr:outer membrane beta-barrel family protein [Parabacteroides sp.]